jgi:hypothetical protein
MAARISPLWWPMLATASPDLVPLLPGAEPYRREGPGEGNPHPMHESPGKRGLSREARNLAAPLGEGRILQPTIEKQAPSADSDFIGDARSKA